MVKSAEDMVIFGDAQNMEQLVQEFQDWQVGLKILKLPEDKDCVLIAQTKAMKQTGRQ